MKKYFGTDGIRGKANTELTPEIATALGRAAVRALPGKNTFVIGRDTRESGAMLEAALVAGLLSEGATIYLAGTIPTPGVAILAEEMGANFGVVISASHNPFDDNGIKFFGRGGVKLPDDAEKSIEYEFERLVLSDTAGTIGTVREISDASERYINHLLGCVDFDFDGYHVALDCANGAASFVAPEVFRRLGADVTAMAVDPDGKNINRECGSTFPGQLAGQMSRMQAELGFALDGDADRCIAVDGAGEIRDGDYIISIIARHLKEKGVLKPPMVVATVMSNLGFMKAMEENGIIAIQAPVGDRYVMEEMFSTGALLGGEQSGHVIFRDCMSTGDGILTALKLSSVVIETGVGLKELSGVMKKYPQVLLNVRTTPDRRLSDEMPSWEVVRNCAAELGESGRVLVRSSGTEPIERVMVEAQTEERARDVARTIADAIREDLQCFPAC